MIDFQNVTHVQLITADQTDSEMDALQRARLFAEASSRRMATICGCALAPVEPQFTDDIRAKRTPPSSLTQPDREYYWPCLRKHEILREQRRLILNGAAEEQPQPLDRSLGPRRRRTCSHHWTVLWARGDEVLVRMCNMRRHSTQNVMGNHRQTRVAHMTKIATQCRRTRQGIKEGKANRAGTATQRHRRQQRPHRKMVANGTGFQRFLENMRLVALYCEPCARAGHLIIDGTPAIRRSAETWFLLFQTDLVPSGAVLCAHSLLHHTESTVMVHNEAVCCTCRRNLDIGRQRTSFEPFAGADHFFTDEISALQRSDERGLGGALVCRPGQFSAEVNCRPRDPLGFCEMSSLETSKQLKNRAPMLDRGLK